MKNYMGRVLTRAEMMMLLMALVLAACAQVSGGVSAAPSDEAVPLFTGEVPGYTVGDNGQRGCYTFWVIGELVTDPKYGTAIKVDGRDGPMPPVPVMWSWPGITGRRVGSEVEVLVDGKVVATTGRRYRIDGGYHEPGFVACDPLRITPK